MNTRTTAWPDPIGSTETRKTGTTTANQNAFCRTKVSAPRPICSMSSSTRRRYSTAVAEIAYPAGSTWSAGGGAIWTGSFHFVKVPWTVSFPRSPRSTTAVASETRVVAWSIWSVRSTVEFERSGSWTGTGNALGVAPVPPLAAGARSPGFKVRVSV